MVVNVAVYLAMVVLDPAGAFQLIRGPSSDAYLVFGAASAGLVEHCRHYWRLLPPMFMHVDLLHLVMNSAALATLTPVVAHAFGLHRTATIYLLSGIGGSLLSHLSGSHGVGASGAICGLLGAVLLYGWRRRDGPEYGLFRWALQWTGIIAIIGLAFPRMIDNYGHLGGFLAGVLLGYPASSRVRTRERAWQAAASACLALVVAVYAIFVVPSLVRLPERARAAGLERFLGTTLDQIERVQHGSAPPADLPRTLVATGESSRPVVAAVEAAIEETRRAPQGQEARRALHGAYSLYVAWQERLLCEYALYPDD